MDETKSQKPERKVQIKVPDYLRAIDSDIWIELEEYLYDGFLTTTVNLAGKTWVFKTLNHHELRYINFLKSKGTFFQSNFIAYSIFIIDGENVLQNRQRHIRKLIKIIEKLPDKIKEKIAENLSAINNKAQRLHPLVEIYVKENRSRYKWGHLKNHKINSPGVTGIPGTDELGLNYCQEVWVSLNNFQDIKEQVEINWSHAKFVGSCLAGGKAIRSVDEKDKSRAAKERQEYEDKKLKVLQDYLNRRSGTREEFREKARLPDGRMADIESHHRADTVEELADQLSAALSGEKDHHDMVVQRHFERLKEQRSKMDELQRTVYQLPEVSLEDAQEVAGSYVLRGGKAAAEERVERMKRLHQQQLDLLQQKQQQISLENSNSDK